MAAAPRPTLLTALPPEVLQSIIARLPDPASFASASSGSLQLCRKFDTQWFRVQHSAAAPGRPWQYAALTWRRLKHQTAEGLATWMLRYARCWQQQQQQQQQQHMQQQQQHMQLQEQDQWQRGAAPDVATAERLVVDGDAVGALLVLCGPTAPLLLLPYAAHGGVTALLQPLALRRLLCPAAGFDLGGGVRPVTQRAQVMAAAKSALLAGRWTDAMDICRTLHSGSSDGAAAVLADLQPFAVRRCPPDVVRRALARRGLRCEPEALCRAFRARSAGGNVTQVFLVCHRQVSSAGLKQRYKDLVRGGMEQSSARFQATLAAGWEAAAQLCLLGAPLGPQPALCEPGVQEELLFMATQHAGYRVSRVAELVAAAATLAATLSDGQLHRQVLRGACSELTTSGERCDLPRALADAVCRLAGNDGAGAEGWGTPHCWDNVLPPLAPAALFAALDEVWSEAHGRGIAVEVLQAVVAALDPPGEAAPQHAVLSTAGRAWLVPRLARAGLRLDAGCAQPTLHALQMQLAGCWFGLGAAGGEEVAEDMALAYFAAEHEQFDWGAQDMQAQRLQLAVMRAVRRGTALDVERALSEQWAVQSQALAELQATALADPDAVDDAAVITSPAFKAWVEQLTQVQDFTNYAAASAAEAGRCLHMVAVLEGPQARHLADRDEDAPLDARGWIDDRPSAALSAMLGAIRSGNLEAVSWQSLGVTVHDLYAWLMLVRQRGGMAWADSLHALLGGRVCGGARVRPPAEGGDAFAPLRRVLYEWCEDGWALDVVLSICGDDASFSARLEDGELMAWLEAEGHPRAWAGRVTGEVAGHLLSCAGSADALRAAASWLAAAEWDD